MSAPSRTVGHWKVSKPRRCRSRCWEMSRRIPSQVGMTGPPERGPCRLRRRSKRRNPHGRAEPSGAVLEVPVPDTPGFGLRPADAGHSTVLPRGRKRARHDARTSAGGDLDFADERPARADHPGAAGVGLTRRYLGRREVRHGRRPLKNGHARRDHDVPPSRSTPRSIGKPAVTPSATTSRPTVPARLHDQLRWRWGFPTESSSIRTGHATSRPRCSTHPSTRESRSTDAPLPDGAGRAGSVALSWRHRPPPPAAARGRMGIQGNGERASGRSASPPSASPPSFAGCPPAHYADALWLSPMLAPTGLADIFMPSWPAALELEQDPVHRHKDVLRHTYAVVRGERMGSPELVLRLAALLHRHRQATRPAR